MVKLTWRYGVEDFAEVRIVYLDGYSCKRINIRHGRSPSVSPASISASLTLLSATQVKLTEELVLKTARVESINDVQTNQSSTPSFVPVTFVCIMDASTATACPTELKVYPRCWDLQRHNVCVVSSTRRKHCSSN